MATARATFFGDTIHRAQNVLWLIDNGNFSQSILLPTVADTSFKIMGLGDFNNDNSVDILWRNADFGHLYLWLMNGTTHSSNVDIISFLDLCWQVVGVNNYNADGKCDILWRNTTTGENLVWLMDGATVSSSVALPKISDSQWEIQGLPQTLNRIGGYGERKKMILGPPQEMEFVITRPKMDMFEQAHK